MTVTPRFLPKERLSALVQELKVRGYCVVGPKIDQDAIVYGELDSVDQLPRGWTDEQAPGHYRLKPRDDDAWFGYNVGPHSWKKYLFPAKSTLLNVTKTDNGWEFVPHPPEAVKYAFLGVRACELAAIRVQNQVFLSGPYPDDIYRERHANLLIIAVNCTQAASTCFCHSMNSGPRCQSGFDLALTELSDGFLCEIGSTAGNDLIAACSAAEATAEQIEASDRARQQAIDQMTRKMDTSDLPGLLLGNLNHPHWNEVGERCLSCTNCTMVCPTCFCSSVNEVSDLNTGAIERQRTWDSCFNPDFSYLGGSLVRNDTAARYRQWLTHKLDSWHSQFGTSGCVGCGRCITWCPVGIDIVEEVEAIRKDGTP